LPKRPTDSIENSFSPSRPMPEPSVKPKIYFVSASRKTTGLSWARTLDWLAMNDSAATTTARTHETLRIDFPHPPGSRPGNKFALRARSRAGKINTNNFGANVNPSSKHWKDSSSELF
jgi:hypothetical protein